jgi:hypothetical protein
VSKPSYFNTMPTIEYQGKTAKNIISRVVLAFNQYNQPLGFYDYVIEDDMRPDQIAYFYYDDANLAWLVMLANNMVNPYFDWPLTTDQFNRNIIKKYGSIGQAKSTIIHYRHVHLGGIISPDTYALGVAEGTLFGDLQITASDYLPVYLYNDELEKNEAKRSIKLIDVKYVETIKSEIKKVMHS